MSVIFLLTAISFVIINILFNCYRYSQQMMAIHTSPLCMYICSSFQIIKSNSSLFENRLALITYWSNRMHQTWYFGNSQTRSLKNVSSVCVKLGRLPPANQIPCTSPNHIERLGLGTLVGSMSWLSPQTPQSAKEAAS